MADERFEAPALGERFEVIQEGWDTERERESVAAPTRVLPETSRIPALEPSSIPPLDRSAIPAPGRSAFHVASSEDLGLPTPSGWSDGLTDTDGPRMWDKLLAAEQARNLRHDRTATIVLVELVGMRALVDRVGPTAALQQFVKVARFIAGDIRKSDHIARIKPARFGVLLTETDEISSINFVDRLQDRCRTAFDPKTTGLRVALGWASPPKSGRLEDAVTVAEQRLTVELDRES